MVGGIKYTLHYRLEADDDRVEASPRSFGLVFAFVFAAYGGAAPLIRHTAAMKRRGIGNPEIGKFCTARCVCAAYSAPAGTSSSPMLSRSMRVFSLATRRLPCMHAQNLDQATGEEQPDDPRSRRAIQPIDARVLGAAP